MPLTHHFLCSQYCSQSVHAIKCRICSHLCTALLRDIHHVYLRGSTRVSEKTCETERTPYPSDMVAERHGFCPRECISARTDEQIVDESLKAARDDLADTEKSSASQDRNLLGTVEQIPDVLAPEIVEQLIKLPKTVSENRIQERTVEHIVVDIPVLQVAEELVEVSKVFPKDRIQQRFAELTIGIPCISLAEKCVEMLVTQTQERMQQVANTHVQHVASTVKVERPKIIKQTVQKAVTQEWINQMTKHMPVQKTTEVSPLQFTEKVVGIPVVAHRQIRMSWNVHETIEIH